MDEKHTRTRFRESVISKARQISQHPTKIICEPLHISIWPEGLSPDQTVVLSYLNGRQIVTPDQIEAATGVKAKGLQFAVLDFDVGMVYYVYAGGESGG